MQVSAVRTQDIQSNPRNKGAASASFQPEAPVDTWSTDLSSPPAPISHDFAVAVLSEATRADTMTKLLDNSDRDSDRRLGSVRCQIDGNHSFEATRIEAADGSVTLTTKDQGFDRTYSFGFDKTTIVEVNHNTYLQEDKTIYEFTNGNQGFIATRERIAHI
jgi:hypothetical protein